MSQPFVMLADVPEPDREALLKQLGKGLARAEGLPAQYCGVGKLPIWALDGQPQRVPQYAAGASLTSMQFEPISHGYWLEALRGRVDVDFDQNAVFWGREGYLHVRLLREQDEGIKSTGMPGRPSKGKYLIDAELERRIAANECEPLLAGEARYLLHWFKTNYPQAHPPTQKLVENNIRRRYAAWKAGRAEPTMK
jgi:hypothetical protein